MKLFKKWINRLAQFLWWWSRMIDCFYRICKSPSTKPFLLNLVNHIIIRAKQYKSALLLWVLLCSSSDLHVLHKSKCNWLSWTNRTKHFHDCLWNATRYQFYSKTNNNYKFLIIDNNLHDSKTRIDCTPKMYFVFVCGVTSKNFSFI